MSRLGRTFAFLLSLPFLLVGAALASNAYAKHRLHQRLEYWRAEAAPLVSQGADVEALKAFAARHGLTLYCNAANTECSARDQEQYGVIPTWHVRLTFTLRAGRISDYTATPLGVGP